MSQKNTPFAEIVADLRRICTAGKSGTIYLSSQLNRSAQIVIDKGSIVYLYYFNRRGREALQAMPEIESGRHRFQEGSVPSLRMEQLSTEEILRYLSVAAGEVVGGGEEAQPGIGGKNGRSCPSEELTEAQRQVLEEGLAFYIGPMASIICEDHLGEAVDPRSAVERLAGEIPDEDRALRFREEMLAKLLS